MEETFLTDFGQNHPEEDQPQNEPSPEETAEGDASEDPRDARIAELEQRVASLEAEAKEAKDEVLRAMAETQTVRRRLREQHEEQLQYAAEGLVRDLLTVLDNLERTLQAAEKASSVEPILKGVKAVDKQMKKALSKHGIERLDSVGESFDPEIHEALETHSSQEHPKDVVTTEIEAGYRLKDRVIRPARVRVSSGGS
jgi:molecular chaperone GrpE